MNSVFVTGATGVLGRPVLRLLHESGYKVRALCRSDANRKLLERAGAMPVEADLFDAESLAHTMDGCEAVLHLATRIPRVKDLKKPGIWHENDRIRRDGMRAIGAAAAQTSVSTILYPSISFFYGSSGDRWIDAANAEVKVTGPLQSTLDAEAEVASFATNSSGRRGVVLRFGAFYGPASSDSVQTLSLSRMGFAMPLAPASAYRSMIWIDDAASAVVKALERAPSGVFDVVEDRPATTAETLSALAAAVGRNRLWPLPRWLLRLALPAVLRDVLARSQRISNARFRDATGWQPAVPDPWQGWARMATSDVESPGAGRDAQWLRDQNAGAGS
ncbi:MAG: NAD(P)-dependent oxidoreductase [Pseudomonadota bacterium]